MHNHPQKSFISVRDAARELGVVPDYVSRLCREGVIAGERRGRVWLVDKTALEAYRSAQVQKKEGWRQQLSLRRREEYRGERKVSSTSNGATVQ
jgi:excisionase family DNA binding protein